MREQAIVRAQSNAVWLAVLLAVSPIFFLIPITHDAAWQMWIGRQMAHGANLYTDIVEVNPPLWFWMATPLAAAAEALGVRSVAVLISFFVASIALSIWLAAKVAGGRVPTWAMLAAMLFPIQHFGQREHFILIFTIPYVLLIAKREQGETVATQDAVLIAFCAALACALKPHFAAVPLALELWAWRVRKVRPETITLAIAGLAYVAAIALFEPDYLTNALPLVTSAYGPFSPMNIRQAYPSMLAFCFASPLLVRARKEAAAFTVGSLTAYLVYLLQAKGWPYQALPALGLLLIAVVLAADTSNIRKAFAVGTAILILVPNLQLYRTPPEFRLDVAPGTSFAALSIAPRAAWPMVEERNLKWPLPYMSLWMAPTVKPDVSHELACNPPELLLIDDRQVNFSGYAQPLLQSYARIGEDARVKLFRRIRMPPKPHNCRIIY